VRPTADNVWGGESLAAVAAAAVSEENTPPT